VCSSDLLSGAGGALLAHWLSHGLHRLLTVTRILNTPVGVDGRILLFALVGSLGSVLLFGLAPALQMTQPHRIAALKEGEVVVDLGSGAGFDCFLAARKVGPSGRVIGIDMTPEMLTKARENARRGGYSNVEFRLGEIEHLPVADQSADVAISNCVINLSPDKLQVFREAWRVLKPGGRLAISDVVATQELPEAIKTDLAAYAGCVAGAALVSDVEALLLESGFTDVKVQIQQASREAIKDWFPGSGVENYVASAIIEAKKGE